MLSGASQAYAYSAPQHSFLSTLQPAWLTAAGVEATNQTAGDAELFALNRGTLGPVGSAEAKADRADAKLAAVRARHRLKGAARSCGTRLSTIGHCPGSTCTDFTECDPKHEGLRPGNENDSGVRG